MLTPSFRPNTLSAISDTVSIIHRICFRPGRLPPLFHVFLNDLPSNDFSTLFKSLPTFLDKMRDDNDKDFRACYVSGVPGSFYGRLFPKGSLHFVQSSSSLHWLSQVVPDELSNRSNHELLNKGRIYISSTSPAGVAEAYLKQFRSDFFLFLKSRSEERARRGRMVLIFRGRSTLDPSSDEACLLWDYLGLAFWDLVARGLLEEEKLDRYKSAYYAPRPEYVEAEIRREGSFIVDSLETVSLPWDIVSEGMKCSRRKMAETMAKAVRAINERMFQDHFGGEIMEPLFERFADIVAADMKEVEHVSLVVSLIRKS